MTSFTGPGTLYDAFDRCAASKTGERAFGRAGSPGWMSRGDLRDEIAGVSQQLREAGTRPGSVILLEGVRGAPFAVCALAVWANEGVFLAPESSSTPQERRLMQKSFRAGWVIRPDRSGSLRVARAESQSAGHEPIDLPSDTCVIKLTSGSTGEPRGIAVTASQLRADAERIIDQMKITPDTVNIAAIPMSHSYGLGNLLMPLVLQGSPVMTVELPTPEGLAAAFEIKGPAAFPGVPYLFDLTARSDSPPSRKELVICISAGVPLSARTAAAFRRLTGWPIRSFYGTSETGGIAFDASPSGDAAERADGMIGAVLPGVNVTLERDEGRVVVASSSVSAGYIGQKLADNSEEGAFHRGAFRTGDTAVMLPVEGRMELRLTGRVSSLVNVAGRKVSPREVEHVLMAMPGLSEAAVMGVADMARGESLLACVVADGSITREKILSHARHHLSPYKLPRKILFLEEMPRTERGKVDRSRLARVATDA